MLSRLFLASLTLLALGAASSPAASASDDAPRRVLWISGDQRLEYALAEDEAVLVPARQGAPRAHLLPAQAIIGSARGSQLRVRLDAAVRSAGDYRARARALARSTGGEVWAVLRQPGEPADNEPTLLTRWVVVRLQPGAEITEALAGVPLAIEQRAPWDWRGTSWVCRATVDDPLAALTAAELARRRPGVANAEAVLRHPFQRCSTNDPLLFDQRHLLAPGSGGINAIGAWVLRNPRLTGKGVVINVNDDGIEAEHPDLRANVLANAGFSYRENQQQSILVTNWQYTDTVGIQRFQSDNHGTACAGLAAAVGNNGIGVAGVAYEASLVDVQHLGQPTAGNAPYPGDLLAAVLTHNLAASDPQVRPWITTNAFGVPKFRWTAMSDAVRQAFESGARARGGRGVVHVFAIGNERREYEVHNMNAIVNNEYVIAVGATDWINRQAPYSNSSASLFVCAPGGIIGEQNIDTALVTTDRSPSGDGYHSQLPYTIPRDQAPPPDLPDQPAAPSIFSPVAHTSFAAAITAGAIALMFDANPKLTYRDVMHILARHSDRIDGTNAGADELGDPNAGYGDTIWDNWVTNGADDIDGPNAVVYYSNRYGFGKVNALNAVKAAMRWHHVPSRRTYETSMQNVNQTIPEPLLLATLRDFNINDPTTHLASNLTVPSNLVPPRFRIERVIAIVEMDHSRGGDLSWYLRSPAGTVAAINQRNLRQVDLTTGSIKLSDQQRRELIDLLEEELWPILIPNVRGEIEVDSLPLTAEQKLILKRQLGLETPPWTGDRPNFYVLTLTDDQILRLVQILLDRDIIEIEDVPLTDQQVHGLFKDVGDKNHVQRWEFVFNAFWGESPLQDNGTWTLYVNDHLALDTGVLKSWQLRFIGYHESEEPAITQVRDIRSPADDEQHPVIVNEDFPTVLTLRGEGFVENDAGDPLTTFLINGVPLDPQYVEIISENEARLTLPASIDLSRETLTIGAENYVFVSQFTGVKGEVTAPQTLAGVPFNFPIVHNRPPRLHVAGPFQVMEDTPFQGRLLATDEDYDPVTFEIVSPPANGTLTLLNPQTGAFRFVPAQDFTGTTTFTARVVDRHGAASPTLTITLRVLPVPQPPGGEATGGAVSDAYGKGGTTGGCLAGGGLVAALLALLAILARGPLRLRRR